MGTKSFFRKIKNNVTPDVASAFANNVWSIAKGPVTMVFILLFLSDVVQGYWYTFISLAALSTFADLGFTIIVGQFSAHEYAHLKINENGLLEGDKEHLERIISLFRFILKWAVVVLIVAFPIIGGAGIAALNVPGSNPEEIMLIKEWIVPWLLYILCSGLNFFASIILSFFEGCNQIGKIQRNRLIGSIVSTLVTWVLLFLKPSLYVLAISAALGVVVNFALLFWRFHKLLKQLLKQKIEGQYKWFKSFMSLIWKYALSWVSGYFIFQIYTPLAKMRFGAVAAGQVGITITLIQACFAIANVWVFVATPKLNMAASKGDWRGMDDLFKKNTLLSIATYLFGALCIVGGYLLFINPPADVYLLNKISELLHRFLGILPMCFLLGAYLLQVPINSVATYGRAHKYEPFMVPSIINAVIVFGITMLCVFTLSVDYIFIGILGANVVLVFVALWMYKKRKNFWHERYAKKYLQKEPQQSETVLKDGNENK